MSRSTITLHRCVEWTLAIVLMFAAVLKLQVLLENTSHVDDGLNFGRTALGLIIGWESALAIWLFIGGFAPARFPCAVGCFFLLTIAACSEVIRGAPSCGCFGHFQVPPRATANFDVLATILLWFTNSPFRAGRDKCRSLIPPIATAALALLAFACLSLDIFPTYAFGRAVDAGTSEPFSWVGRDFPLFNEIDGSQALRFGRWEVVFYRFDCDECRRVIPTLLRFASLESCGSGQSRLAFVAVPPFPGVGQDLVPDNSIAPHLRLHLPRDGSILAPLIVTIQDGEVTDVSDASSIPEIETVDLVGK